jgi:hypothetical protein
MLVCSTSYLELFGVGYLIAQALLAENKPPGGSCAAQQRLKSVDMASSVAFAIRVLTLASDNGAAPPQLARALHGDLTAPWPWRPFKMLAARPVGRVNLTVLPPLNPRGWAAKASGETAVDGPAPAKRRSKTKHEIGLPRQAALGGRAVEAIPAHKCGFLWDLNLCGWRRDDSSGHQG